MYNVYRHGQPDRATGVVSSAQEALRALRAAVQGGADAVLHTGDLVNFPSPKAVEATRRIIEQECGLPLLYISGNHDWCYGHPAHFELDPDTARVTSWEGEWTFRGEGRDTGETHRAHWRDQQRVLDPLFDGRSRSHWFHDPPQCKGTLRFVGIDNTTYSVTEEQLAFLDSMLQDVGRAVLLMVHIPLHLPELVETMRMGGRNVSDAVCGNPAAKQHTPDKTTTAFLERVKRAGERNLVAVLAGHIHSAQAQRVAGAFVQRYPGDRVPYPCLGCMQYVTDAGCFGGHRRIAFEPDEGAAASEPTHRRGSARL